MAPPLDRADLFADTSLCGLALSRAYVERVDAWLGKLYELASAGSAGAEQQGIALVAVGGYGRGELAPQSDLDLLLLHTGGGDVAKVAEQIWYPIWDEGLKLGHSVRTAKEALALAASDLDTATSLVTIRHLAGDPALTADLAERGLALWRKRSRRWLGEMSSRVSQRHTQAGEVAFLLEPDLKEGRGGLRDVHAIQWAELAQAVMLEGDDANLAANHDVLFAVRVELHRRTGRPGDRLVLEEQDAVAAALGYVDADQLMAAVSTAARSIAWTSDEVWERVDSALKGPLGWKISRDRALAPGVVLRDGRVCLTATAEPTNDPLLVLRVAVAAAEADARIDRTSLDRLARDAAELPTPWSEDTRNLFARLLLAGRPAIDVIETLDQRGLFVQILPEWAPVRSKPQRNAYHRFTVDRHLCETAANASALVDRVDRADLLVVGALLHDIGKGYPGDHTEVGIEVVGMMGPRMGFPPEDTVQLQDMVRHHLLLPDVASRRDLSDDGTIRSVAQRVGSSGTLALLDALTEADSLATGPAAWSSWKAELVRELVGRVNHVLEGGTAAEATAGALPPPELLARMEPGERVLEGQGDRLLVISPDRLGLFSRVAAVLALSGLDVLEAAAYSDERGMALDTFRVKPGLHGDVPWDRVEGDLAKALDGRLALNARLRERARVYRRPVRRPQGPSEPQVLVDNELSEVATVLEVRAPDEVGVLYRITRAIADMDLDIRSAKVHTIGPDVVDSFYVRDRSGAKVTDPEYLVELERSIIGSL
jgi:[protein-PII] uridylyltransferase